MKHMLVTHIEEHQQPLLLTVVVGGTALSTRQNKTVTDSGQKQLTPAHFPITTNHSLASTHLDTPYYLFSHNSSQSSFVEWFIVTFLFKLSYTEK